VLGGIEFCDGRYACADGADALVIVTEWEQFRALDFERLRSAMKQCNAHHLRELKALVERFLPSSSARRARTKRPMSLTSKVPLS
jgi:hypothetical protein